MIYVIVFFILLLLSIRFDFLGQRGLSKFWYAMAFIILVCLAGFRYKVGGDTIMYFYSFENIPKLGDLFTLDFNTAREDPFWLVLASIAKTISDDFTILQFFQSIIINVILFNFFSKYTPYKFTAVLMYYLFFYIYFNMEILREAIAVCFFLLAYSSLQKEKMIGYYLLCTVAFLFHSSAIITFIFPLFRNQKLNTKTVTLLILSLLLVMGSVFFGVDIIGVLLFNQRIADKFEAYKNLTPSFLGFSYYFLMYTVWPYLIYRWLKKNEKLKFNELIVIYFAVAIIVSFFTGFARFINYFTPFMLISFVDYLHMIFRSKRYRQLREPVIIVVFLISLFPKIMYYTTDTSYLIKGTRKYDLVFPYISVFDKSENYQKERIVIEMFNYHNELAK